MIELETADNEIIVLSIKMADEILWTSSSRQIWSKIAWNMKA
jgi:hypothetical protein